MTPQQARDSLRRILDKHGSRATISRGGTSVPDLLVRVKGFDPDELVNGLDQGTRKIVLLNEGLGSFVPRKGDILTVDGVGLAIEDVDQHSRRIAGELIGYNIAAKG